MKQEIFLMKQLQISFKNYPSLDFWQMDLLHKKLMILGLIRKNYTVKKFFQILQEEKMELNALLYVPVAMN